MDRLSKALNRILLCIFALLISAGPVLCIASAEGKSYILALAGAIIVLSVCTFLLRKFSLCDKVNRLNPKHCALVLSALCLAVKLSWVLLFRIEPTVDYATFYDTARAFAGETGFNSLYLSLFPHIMGYGWFLGQFFKLFGSGLMVAPIANAFLTLATGVMIFYLLNKHCSLFSACFAYALWILCPSATLYNAMTLSEPYYTCLFFAFFCIVSYLDEKDGSGKSQMLAGAICGALAGVLLALINAARPIAAVAIIAFMIWYLFLRGKKSYSLPEIKKFASFAVLMIAVYIISGNLWTAKIEKTLGTEISSFPGYSVYVGFDMDSMGTYSADAGSLLSSLANENGSKAAQQEMFSLAKVNFCSGKINFAQLFKNKFIAFLGNDEGGAYYSLDWLTDLQYSLLAYVSDVFYYALAVLCIINSVHRLKKTDGSILNIIPICIVGIIAAQMLVEVSGRYHYCLIPMLISVSSSYNGIGR